MFAPQPVPLPPLSKGGRTTIVVGGFKTQKLYGIPPPRSAVPLPLTREAKETVCANIVRQTPIYLLPKANDSVFSRGVGRVGYVRSNISALTYRAVAPPRPNTNLSAQYFTAKRTDFLQSVLIFCYLRYFHRVVYTDNSAPKSATLFPQTPRESSETCPDKALP